MSRLSSQPYLRSEHTAEKSPSIETERARRESPQPSGKNVTSPPAEQFQPSQTAETVASAFGLTRRDQWVLGVLALTMLVLMACHWARLSGWGLKPVEIERFDHRPYVYQIDVNRASWVEWMLLDGIGEVLAQRIVEDRDINGPFRSIDDLERVKGIGPKTLARIRPHLKLSPPELSSGPADEGRNVSPRP